MFNCLKVFGFCAITLIMIMRITQNGLSSQAGGHGTCITQCRSAKIVTRKTIPMQVDGEASRLNPATIDLSFFNQVCNRLRLPDQCP